MAPVELRLSCYAGPLRVFGCDRIRATKPAAAPFWDMPTTSFHEGVPGHHLQLTLQRQADLPMISKAEDYNAYVEGWAL